MTVLAEGSAGYWKILMPVNHTWRISVILSTV